MSRRQARREAAQAKADQAVTDDVIQSIMATPGGRMWMWEFLTNCHIFATTYTGIALSAAFAEGERNVGLRILADLMRVCPQQYIVAMHEAEVRGAEPASDVEIDGDQDG